MADTERAVVGASERPLPSRMEKGRARCVLSVGKGRDGGRKTAMGKAGKKLKTGCQIQPIQEIMRQGERTLEFLVMCPPTGSLLLRMAQCGPRWDPAEP